MKIYLVGGAVRDTLLGYPIKERDWVVIGARPEEMIKKGFLKVGKSFPVFLHPETKEEYALGRKEKKTGEGYYGFECDFSPQVTLEEDLKRRDLTINAMAIEYDKLKDIKSHLIDPFEGQRDLKNKVLRHVSPAFSEDPVRLLRVARFSARFHSLGFKVAPETLRLMQDIVHQGEVEALIPERVWQELESALKTDYPLAFIQVLKQTGALKRLFPEIDRLYGVPQTAIYHPEIDTGIHTEMVLSKITALSSLSEIRFGALVHDLGKGMTPVEQWPSHKGHEERGVAVIEGLCKRLKAPALYRELAVLVSRYHLHCHRAFELRSDTILKVLMNMDAFRRPDRFEAFLLICQADAQGRLGLDNKPYPQRAYLWNAFQAANQIKASDIIKTSSITLKGLDLKEKILQARTEAIETYKRAYQASAEDSAP